jgi:hypothetical protein
MIPLWKGKNPIYFGVITIIPFDNLYRRAYFVMHTFLVQLSHGENKLHSMKWWGPLCTGPACLIGSLYNVVLSSLNQQFVGSEPTSLNSLKLCASFTSISFLTRGCRGCDHMVVGFTTTYIICMQSVPITTKVCEILHYFVSVVKASVSLLWVPHLHLLLRHHCSVWRWLVGFMVFNATLSNISVISWRSVLLVEENGENHGPVTNHWDFITCYIE